MVWSVMDELLCWCKRRALCPIIGLPGGIWSCIWDLNRCEKGSHRSQISPLNAQGTDMYHSFVSHLLTVIWWALYAKHVHESGLEAHSPCTRGLPPLRRGPEVVAQSYWARWTVQEAAQVCKCANMHRLLFIYFIYLFLLKLAMAWITIYSFFF